MAVYRGFDPPSSSRSAGRSSGQVSPEELAEALDGSVQVVMNGRGLMGAVAALPFFTRYQEALEPWNETGEGGTAG